MNGTFATSLYSRSPQLKNGPNPAQVVGSTPGGATPATRRCRTKSWSKTAIISGVRSSQRVRSARRCGCPGHAISAAEIRGPDNLRWSVPRDRTTRDCLSRQGATASNHLSRNGRFHRSRRPWPRLKSPGSAAPLRSALSRVHLAGASLSFVVRDRELDAANRRVAARHILTDGHPAAVLRTCWIAGDFAGHDDALQWKRVVIAEGYIDDQQLPECRQFCCVIDSLLSGSCDSVSPCPSRTETSSVRRLRASAVRRISHVFLMKIDNIAQRALAAKVPKFCSFARSYLGGPRCCRQLGLVVRGARTQQK
jgi:hypothetical protein